MLVPISSFYWQRMGRSSAIVHKLFSLFNDAQYSWRNCTNYFRTLWNTFFFIGPESDHCLPLSVTHSLTHSLTDSCLVNLIDVTLACEDANSKLVEVVTVADVDAEDHAGNSFLIRKLTFGHKAKLLFKL